MRIEQRGTHVMEHCGTPKITRRWRKLGEGAAWFCSCGKKFRLSCNSGYDMDWWTWDPVEES